MNTRLINPPISELEAAPDLCPRPVRLLIDKFNVSLPLQWEIFVRPHLNGLTPDMVLLNPNVGIAVFAVLPGTPDTQEIRKAGAFLTRTKFEIADLYCPRIGGKSGLSTITTGLLLPDLDTTAHQSAQKALREDRFYGPICDRAACNSQDVRRLLPSANIHNTDRMKPELAADFRSWLIEPDYSVSNRTPLKLDARQQSIVDSRTTSGARRIRGPAGSGKSLVLAAKAAQLAYEGRTVLVATFNITMIAYLRSLALSWPVPKNRINSHVTWLNFHNWCKRTLTRSLLWHEYGLLWHQVHEDDQTPEVLPGDKSDPLDDVLRQQLPELTLKAIRADSNGIIPRYDAIMVDEGQDYHPQWWATLREVLKPGGEMLFVADPTQNLYGRDLSFTHGQGKMGAGSFEGLNAGFTGPWMEFSNSYRLPPTLVPILTDYLNTFLPASENTAPRCDQQDTGLINEYPFTFNWIVTTEHDAVTKCVGAIMNMPGMADPDVLAIPDIVFICDKRAVGAAVVGQLQQLKLGVAHTFGDRQREKKLTFTMEKAPIKATTIHSYKGWESRSIVLHVSNARDVRALSAFYVGMSRVKRHSAGSYLTVVCSAPKLNAFGSKWKTVEQASPGYPPQSVGSPDP